MNIKTLFRTRRAVAENLSHDEFQKFVAPRAQRSRWFWLWLWVRVIIVMYVGFIAGGILSQAYAADMSAPAPTPVVRGVNNETGITTTGLLDAATSTRSDSEAMSGHWALRQIFGAVVDNPLSPTDAIQSGTVLAAVFYILNLVLLAVAVLFVSYKFISAAVATGQDGEFLGKRESKPWMPVRSLVGIGALCPVFGGWSLAQLVALWFAMLGVGAGNIAWNAATDFLAKGGQLTQQAPLSARADIAEKLFRMHVCRVAIASSILDARAENADVAGIAAIYDPTAYTNPAIPAAGGRVAYGQDGACGVISLPTYAATQAATTGAIEGFYSTVETQRARSELSRATVQAVNNNFATLNAEMAAMAEAFIQKTSLDYNAPVTAPQVADPTDPLARAVGLGYDVRAIRAAEARFNDANAAAIRQTMSTTNDEYKTVAAAVNARAKDEGFLTAGAYFSSVAKMGNALKEAVNAGVVVEQEASTPDDSAFMSLNERYVRADALDRDGKKAAGKLIGGNMGRGDAAALAKKFEAIRQQRPDISKPVWHNSLRLPAGDKLSPQGWASVADEYMRRMGFSDSHQRAYILHDDADGQHIHIIANRVDLLGNLYYGKNENLASTRIISKLERDFHLTQTTAFHDAGAKTGKKVRLKKGEIEKALRTNSVPPRMRLAAALAEAMKGKSTVIEMVERMEAAGFIVVPNISDTGRLNGFSFECDGVAFKGSQVGASAAQMRKAGITYEQTRWCRHEMAAHKAIQRMCTAARNEVVHFA